MSNTSIETRDSGLLIWERDHTIELETDVALATEFKFRRALNTIETPFFVQQLILNPSQVTTIPIPLPSNFIGIQVDEGSPPIQLIPTVRVCHHIGDIGMPTKGGIRVLPVSKLLSEKEKFHFVTSEAIALSRESLAKVSVINFPQLCSMFGIDTQKVFGGGAKGVIAIPEHIYIQAKQAGHLKTLVSILCENFGYSYGLRNIINPYTDSVAPDMDTYGFMDDLLRGYRRALDIQRTSIPDHISQAVVTSKSIENGGTPSRLSAIGFGAVTATEQILREAHMSIPGKRFIIDGAGNAALYAAIELVHKGGIIIGISDSSGHIISKSGIDIDKFLKAKRNGLSVKIFYENGMIGAKYLPPGAKESYLSDECDILLLASGDNVINRSNASGIKPKSGIVVEASNVGITPSAADMLHENNIEVIPGIVAGAGGLIASWLEWLGNLEQKVFTLEEGYKAIEYGIELAISEVIKEANTSGISWVDAAYIIAAKKATEMTLQYALKNRFS